MKDTSRPIFELTKPLPEMIGAPLRAVTETFATVGFRYFLVGATARAIILENVFGRPSGRLTRDLDFGVAVSNWEEFGSLATKLIKTGRFEETPAIQRLHYLYSSGVKSKIDLIPFGGIEDGNSSIAWPPKRDTIMNVAGFSEALEAAILVRTEPDLIIPVASLAGLIILKLFAWMDRKYERRDAPDILTILSEYVEAGNEERLYESESALFEAAGFDIAIAGALMLGKDVRLIASEDIAAKLTALLTDEPSVEQLVDQMVQTGRRFDQAFAQHCASLLDNFRNGFLQRVSEKEN